MIDTTHISSRGQLVIPVRIRKAMKLEARTPLVVKLKGKNKDIVEIKRIKQ